MRVLRSAALVLSMVLLVGTLLSGLNRRGDVRDAQQARLDQASVVTRSSVSSTIVHLTDLVALSARATTSSDAIDDRGLADELARAVPGSEACVGNTVASCTGANLFSLQTVSDLAVRSERTDPVDGASQPSGAVAVDAVSDSILVVRRVTDGDRSATAVVRVPTSALLDSTSRQVVDALDANAVVRSVSTTSSGDAAVEVDVIDGRRTSTATLGSTFVSGSIEIVTSVDGTVGLGGDRTVRYAILLTLGTVLLALAGWTLFIERRHLERQATTDDLTQLINRREFERVSAEALDMADRFNTGLSIMVVDLNGFKQINDTLGHQFGDLVLTAASERFVEAVRDTDVVGRWGGDEFVILLPGLSERSAVRGSAERIWNHLAGSPVVGDTTITASIGAAIFPRHGTTLEALMRAADVAMYEAKTTGVSHRIADTMTVKGAMFADEELGGDDLDQVVVHTDEYEGPDRRRSPVPPPPVPPASLSASGESRVPGGPGTGS